MNETVARALIAIASGYLLAGAAFAVPFVLWGAGEVEPVARDGTPGFRLLILPGAVTLWPLLLARWIRARATR
jgi:hypothetical protein